MQCAIIGLGRMGKNVALHLLEQGVSVVAYNRSRDDVDEAVAKGASGAYTLEELPHKWAVKPMVMILFLPSGATVDEVITKLVQIVPAGSVVIDGGNSFYKDSQRRYSLLKEKGIHFLDMGTSGGLEGARTGACLMVGGDEEVYKQVEPLLSKIAMKEGLSYFGPSGAGHFVKMVHNGIEYAIVQAYGEGIEILHKGPFQIDLAKATNVWNHGSVIRSWIGELIARAFTKDPKLDAFTGQIAGGETGVWTYKAAQEFGVDAPAIKSSLMGRKKSQIKPTFSGKVVSALRNQWGDHAEGKLHPSLEELDLEEK